MKTIQFGSKKMRVPAVAVGCMRLNQLSYEQAEEFIQQALELDATFFDHADIYGDGECERIFGKILGCHPSMREQMMIQSKCGIVPGKMYDLSRQHIVECVDASLQRLQTEYLDVLVLHRPDTLMDPEEIAYTFDYLQKSGKVRNFGVSNMNPMQIELLLRYVRQPICVNQMQLSITNSNMISGQLEVNMETPGGVNRDGYILDYCRSHSITIQTWSPFQYGMFEGCFIGSEKYPELNQVLSELADKYGVNETTIAAAWILRHPAKMQLLTGTTNGTHLREVIAATQISLTREEWYQLYLAGGHILP